jgi:hypothetical protein
MRVMVRVKKKPPRLEILSFVSTFDKLKYKCSGQVIQPKNSRITKEASG